MTKTIKHIVSIVLTLVACMAPSLAHADAGVKVTVKCDSTAVVMGDRLTVNVEVLKNQHPGALIGLPEKNQDYYGLEFLDIAADSADLGNGRTQLNYHIYFQAFDPAEALSLPPFRYVTGADTARSEILSFKVLPVELSSELGDPSDIENLTIHPDEQPIVVKLKWYDYIPNWTIWVVLGLLALALGVVLWQLYKKNGPAIFVPRRQPTPYEIAVQRLNDLRGRRLLEQGQVKTYYTELIDILRTYLDGRFGINAMEMPSKTILQKLRQNKDIHLSTQQIEQALHLADFVKFAAANPNSEEGLRTFNTVSQFVESTKPEEPKDEEKDKTQDKKENK